MKPGRFLRYLILMSVFAASFLFAKDRNNSVRLSDKENMGIVLEQSLFDILQSNLFFNSKCLTTINCLSFPLAGTGIILSMAPKPDLRNLEEKIADGFLAMTAYPGGTFLYNMALNGRDLVSYSRQKTSFEYQGFNFVSSIGGSGKRFLKTGVYYYF